MVGVVSEKGKSFEGLINYLFEGRLKDRGSANKRPEIVSHSENVRVPFGVEDKVGRNRLISDLISQAKLHRNYGDHSTKYIGEHILSFTEEDIKKLGKDQIKKLCEQYVKDADIDRTQYVAVSHADTNNYHIHIVFNRCQNDNTLYPDWKEKTKTAERAIALAIKYDLGLTDRQEQMADSKGVLEIRSKHQDIIDLAKEPILKKIRNIKHFEKICEAQNIPFSLKRDKLNVGNKTFKKRDLEAVFFKNRQMSKEARDNKKANEYSSQKRKIKQKPAYTFKKEKIEQKSEGLQKQDNSIIDLNLNNELLQNIPQHVEENQEFNNRKAYGKSDKEEKMYYKRRKKR
ncbi:relaxase/mobilization nuclease domain-containing protein [Arcicella sp. DC2W]|uniref:Relaxase/mobilization nuclease domain-containing protein n=1 Tax=Arcicella gelida TaxID=2984195 RepID=A0ABU5S3E3_9BACT|nr:relaxase/mobilization nuclease domain-containing protein [Arcicella sp. DC2W]MEA5402960.1 relaxase/mobilization nuclease domain-containing protein [Arcicella sp. DC2W]